MGYDVVYVVDDEPVDFDGEVSPCGCRERPRSSLRSVEEKGQSEKGPLGLGGIKIGFFQVDCVGKVGRYTPGSILLALRVPLPL